MCACLNASAAALPMSSADQANQQLPVCIGWAREPVGAPNKKLMHEPPHQQLRTISDSLQKHPDSECQVLSLMGEREREEAMEIKCVRERAIIQQVAACGLIWPLQAAGTELPLPWTDPLTLAHPKPTFGSHSISCFQNVRADKRWTQGRST